LAPLKAEFFIANTFRLIDNNSMKLFSETCELLAQEASTLKKVEIICDALSQIHSDDELYLFCINLTGVVYPSTVQKTINVGQAFVRDAAIKLAGITREDWDKVFREFGEMGETVEAIIKNEELRINNDKSIGTLAHSQIDNSEVDALFEGGPTLPSTNEVSLQVFKEYVELLNQNSRNLVKVEIIADLLRKLTPLEAKYAVKLLLGKMRIGVQEATVEDAISKAFEEEKKHVKHLNFYIGDIGEVAIRCKKKDFANVEFHLFHPIRAMLASAEVDTAEIFKRMGGNVWVEYKYDGIRAHIHKKGGQVEIFTRDQKNITKQFPEVAQDMLQFPDDFLIDGEIVPFRMEKIQAFADLQKRLGRKEKMDEAVRDNPTRFVGYDFLYLNHETLFEKALRERRELLEKTFGGKMMYSTQKIVTTPEEFKAFFFESKSEGREGLMVKNPESTYEAGKRGIHWLKYKETLDPLDVVVLIAEYGEGKNAKYLSNYTFGVWDEKKENLIPVGRVYSGIKEDELKYFTEYLPTIATGNIERGFTLEPKVIFEVGFENIQKSERYISGFAVRFPRILRIRTDDKPLNEIATIDDVKRNFEKLNII
jgi:DNA ligase-1